MPPFVNCSAKDTKLVDCHQNKGDSDEYYMVGKAAKQARQWNKFLVKALSSQDVINKINNFKRTFGYPLDFYPKLTDKGKCALPADMPRIESLYCPCGTEIIIFVKNLTNYGYPSEYLELDDVYEIDSSGSVLNKWVVPVNRGITAINGRELYLYEVSSTIASQDNEYRDFPALLAVSDDRTFKLIERRDDLPEPISIDCPPTHLFEGSDYKRCWQFRDMGTGKIRTLIFQGPCT